MTSPEHKESSSSTRKDRQQAKKTAQDYQVDSNERKDSNQNEEEVERDIEDEKFLDSDQNRSHDS